MNLWLLLLIFVVLQGPTPTPRKVGNPPQQQTTAPNQSAASDHYGTQESPLVVKVSPSPKTKEESDQETQDRNAKAASDRWTIGLTGVLALVAFLQLLVYGYQAKKLRETVESAKEQSSAMERHISEAARSAKAMEGVVTVIRSGNEAALRAYLTVLIGTAIYQEKREGMVDLKFEAKPLLVNTGNTPARNLCMKKAADILPIPIPEDFKFPLPEEWITGVGAVGAHQNYTIGEVIDDYVPWGEVGAVKKGVTRALCIWGIVTYEDIFGVKHFTQFWQIINWQMDGQTIYGHYIAGQNDGD
jgi:DNA-binding protein YbaB